MSNQNASKDLNDQIKEFLGLIVLAIIVIFVVLFLIYKFITEILIPILIGLFLLALGLVLTIISVRVLAHLFAYFTLEKRCRRKLAALTGKVSQLDESEATMVERMSTWPDQRQFTAKAELGRLGIARDELNNQIQNTATALADHLADKLDAVNRSRNKTLRKIQRRPSDKLNQKQEKEDKKAAHFVSELERLELEYYIEPDPAFKRKERKYPLISAFDSYVSSLFNKDSHQ
jgi:hypothetical protein